MPHVTIFALTHSGKTKSRLALSPPSSASAPCFNSACELPTEGAWRVRMKTKYLGWDALLGKNVSQTSVNVWHVPMEVIYPQQLSWNWWEKARWLKFNLQRRLGMQKSDRTCKSVKSYNLLHSTGLKKNRLKEIPSWSWRPCTPVCALHEKLQGEEWSHSCSGHPHWPRAKDRIERNQGGSSKPRETNCCKTSESVNCLFQSFGSIV